MVSLNDVLLAMSNIPVDDPIAEIWGRGLQGGYKIIEYTGALPITINANGDVLIDYRIYGADGGVGESTENLLDYSKCEAGAIGSNGDIGHARNNSEVSDYIDVSGESYVVIAQNRLHNTALTDQYMAIGCWDENYAFISNSRSYKHIESTASIEVVTLVKQLPSGTKYVRANFLTNEAHESIESVDAMIIIGSDIPTSYVPYGYKLPMTVSDGNTVQTVPVYIGENQLEDDEYVSYSEQAIYKRTENLCPPLSSSKWSPGYITSSGTIATPSVTRQEKVSDWIKVDGGNDYCFYDKSGFPTGGGNAWFGLGAWDKKRNWLRRYSWEAAEISYKTQNLPDDVAYVRLSMRTYGEDDDDLSFTNGSIPPDPYIPYLESTDPPVPLPEIPTIKGETVIDYDGEPKPSQMYVKYKSKG